MRNMASRNYRPAAGFTPRNFAFPGFVFASRDTKHETRNTNHGLSLRDTKHESRLFPATALSNRCLLVLKGFSLFFGREPV